MRSNWPRKKPTLFLDRNLGRHIIANRLRREGIPVEVHDDHLPTDAPDEAWIALTKDNNLRYRTAEIKSVAQYKARVIVIRAKNATGPDIAELLVRGRHRISRFAAKQDAPFVAAIYRDGRVKKYPADLSSRV